MPELPDVEAYRRHLAATSLHRRIDGIERVTTEMLTGVSASMFRRKLVGTSLETSRRHGKYLFARTDDGPWLVLHFGMTGRLECDGRERSDNAHTHLVLTLHDGCSLAFEDQRKLGGIWLTDDVDEFIAARRLGPDALDVDKAGFLAALEGRRGAVKPTLMNQSIVAGIGNVYSDEILFQTRLHPRGPIQQLDERARVQLHRTTRRVLRTAADRKADPERMPRTWLLPHREEGEPCPRCGGLIERIRAAGRSAYLCPRCQRP
jgi:formamidopyrimidine-DNA glycosylase